MTMKTFWTFLFFSGITAACSAQTVDGTPLIHALNERMAAQKNGMFTIDARFKFADGEDTIAHQGTCYFFRESNPDSFAQFVVVSDDRPVLAFDGKTFFQSMGPEKYWVTDVAEAGGVRRMLRGNVMKSNLVYHPFFRVDQPNFGTSSFENVQLTAVQENGLNMVRLIMRDTSIEEALGDVENNKIYFDVQYDIALPDYYFVRRTESVWLFDGWQYDRKLFSPIAPLPEGAKFSDYFDPEKLADRYTFEQYDPNAPVKREKELIKTGDQLPDFALTDLQGKTIALNELNDGLILLDFWYKGCFPCQLAMPKIENLHQKYAAKGLHVFGVNPFDKNNEQIKDWLKTRNVTYNTVFDPEKQLPSAVGIQGYPLLIIADVKTKAVLYVHTGFSEEMEAELEPVIVENLR
ncbi:MAG: TlpA disulfide reductase family protein [Saprospiraceae bacterium]